ncbi:hypothetical protein L3X38_025131 [Prunus dulcis]|uniref:Retrotransposon gag domain-containing protein n=1 Tax=Prunus dulcis TaxID=3755 RepID=A0AAD4W188_PRUDU|nr:hypothetical protein L3X38_025131 [Prunus dulcis]
MFTNPLENPYKLNLLTSPTGRTTKGIDPWRLRRKLTSSIRGTKDADLSPKALRAEDVERLVNDPLQSLQLKGSTEETLRREVEQVNSTHFTDKVEQATLPKWFTTPAITPLKAYDTQMCKVLAQTLRGTAQDWFHILPSVSIGSFKEFALIFTKEYTSYRTPRK